MSLTALVFPMLCYYHYFYGVCGGFLVLLSEYYNTQKFLERRNCYNTVGQMWFDFFVCGFLFVVFLLSITVEKLSLKTKQLTCKVGGSGRKSVKIF